MKNDDLKNVLRSGISLVCIAIFLSANAAAQVDKYELTDAPPPLKVIAETERKRLDAADGAKDRTKLALKLMQARLDAAEAKADATDYAAMFAELGAFHAIMDDTFVYIDRLPKNEDDRLNNFKRFEIGLRKMNPQIDLLRRNAPPERERYLYYLSRNVRDARTRAIEPQFSNTVVPQARQQNNN